MERCCVDFIEFFTHYQANARIIKPMLVLSSQCLYRPMLVLSGQCSYHQANACIIKPMLVLSGQCSWLYCQCSSLSWVICGCARVHRCVHVSAVHTSANGMCVRLGDLRVCVCVFVCARVRVSICQSLCGGCVCVSVSVCATCRCVKQLTALDVSITLVMMDATLTGTAKIESKL